MNVISLLWLIPALPFTSALVLLLFGPRFSRRATAAVGVGSIGLSALIAILVAISFLSEPPAGNSYTQVLWTWINVAGFEPQIGLYLDALSLVMVLVVTFVALPDSHLFGRVHDRRRGLQPFLRLYESVRRVDDHAAAGG